MIELHEEDFETLAIAALRYCQGRRTYMPDTVRRIVAPHLKEISDTCLNVMLDDCEFQRNMDLYGDEMDKLGWLFWEETLKREENRRKEK